DTEGGYDESRAYPSREPAHKLVPFLSGCRGRMSDCPHNTAVILQVTTSEFHKIQTFSSKKSNTCGTRVCRPKSTRIELRELVPGHCQDPFCYKPSLSKWL